MSPKMRGDGRIQSPWQSFFAFKQSQMTGRFQHSDSTVNTLDISVFGVGPLAVTVTLSRNCDKETMLPGGVFHSRTGVICTNPPPTCPNNYVLKNTA